jgi:hypothetical protein
MLYLFEMKLKYLTLLFFLVLTFKDGFADSRPVKRNDPSQLVKELLSISPRKYSKLTGDKLNVIERIAFRIQQKRIARSLNKMPYDKEWLIDQLWTLMGLFIFGVPLAYITRQSREHKWAAWRGLIALAGALLLIGLLAASLSRCAYHGPI